MSFGGVNPQPFGLPYPAPNTPAQDSPNMLKAGSVVYDYANGQLVFNITVGVDSLDGRAKASVQYSFGSDNTRHVFEPGDISISDDSHGTLSLSLANI